LPLFTHPGSGSTDLGSYSTGNVRRDISDLLLSSLATENNFIGSLGVGEEFGDTTLTWLEDSLNAQVWKDNTVSGLTSGTTTMTAATAADAGVLEVGAIFVDETLGDFVAGEQFQVTAISGTTITVTRGYGSTTAVAHASGNYYRVIDRPTYENSDLGRDLTKARIVKTNIISRFERNINISSEAILRAKYNYAPGVPNELKYQFEQRLRELLREMNNAALYSRLSAASTTGDYATMGGLVYWLDAVGGNTTAAPYKAAGAALSDAILNNQNRTLVNNGATPDWAFGGTMMADNLSKLYNDRIRIVQDDTTRGFKVKEFDTTLQNTLRILWDRQIYDNTPTAPNVTSTSANGLMFILDSGRIRVRPFLESMFFTIQAPNFRDGDACRMLSKWSMEVRNTGTDAGAAHVMLQGLNF
jgi:hypothetical protein